MSTDPIEAANQLLRAHALAAVRVVSWDAGRSELRLEVFHVEWPGDVFGELRFEAVSYVQMPDQTS